MKSIINISNTVSLDNANNTYQALRRIRIAKVCGMSLRENNIYVDFKMTKNKSDDYVRRTVEKIIAILKDNSDIKKSMHGETIHKWTLDGTNPNFIRLIF